MPLSSWWKKLDLNELSISELFEDLLSWNLESKLITPKNITGTYFGAIIAIFNFSFLVCFLYVMFSNPWAGPQSRSCHLFFQACNIFEIWNPSQKYEDMPSKVGHLCTFWLFQVLSLVFGSILCQESEDIYTFDLSFDLLGATKLLPNLICWKIHYNWECSFDFRSFPCHSMTS